MESTLPEQARRPAKRLDGRRVIVTGAGSVGEGFGTGRATAIVLAMEGARVALVDANAESAEATLAMITAEGGEGIVCEGDITRDKDCAAMVSRAAARFGGLDALVNNVGISRVGRVTELSEDDWDQVQRVNLKAMFLMAKHAIPEIQRGQGGSIVNISSIGAILPNTTTPLSAYSASKGGVEALTRALAVEHGCDGIRANCVAPGPILTPRQEVHGLDKETRARRRALALTGDEGTAWDIAWATVYLLSDEARWVNGVVLPVDGGVSVRGHSYR